MKECVTIPLSPNTRWGLKEPLNVIHLKNWEFLLLFGETRIITVQKGVLNFRIKNKFFYYTIYKTEMLHKLNFNKVRIRFDMADVTYVHLFGIEDDEYLETIKPSPRAFRNKAAQKQEDKANIREHAEKVEEIVMKTTDELAYYNEIVNKVKNQDIPLEMVNPSDEKDVADKAALNYFLGITEEVEVKTIASRRKGREMPEDEATKESLRSAKKYQYAEL